MTIVVNLELGLFEAFGAKPVPVSMELDIDALVEDIARLRLGNEAVDWISKKTKLSREDAVSLGQKMIDKGIFHHVLDEHQFKDEALFYRFSDDEGKSIWNSSM